MKLLPLVLLGLLGGCVEGERAGLSALPDDVAPDRDVTWIGVCECECTLNQIDGVEWRPGVPVERCAAASTAPTALAPEMADLAVAELTPLGCGGTVCVCIPHATLEPCPGGDGGV